MPKLIFSLSCFSSLLTNSERLLWSKNQKYPQSPSNIITYSFKICIFFLIILPKIPIKNLSNSIYLKKTKKHPLQSKCFYGLFKMNKCLLCKVDHIPLFANRLNHLFRSQVFENTTYNFQLQKVL